MVGSGEWWRSTARIESRDSRHEEERGSSEVAWDGGCGLSTHKTGERRRVERFEEGEDFGCGV